MTKVGDWEAKTGTRVVFRGNAYDFGIWKAQQESGAVEFDVAGIDGPPTLSFADEGWLLPIDWSVVGRDGFVDVPNMIRDDGVPIEFYGFPIVYNTASFGANPPTSWADVFDVTKYPGKRAFYRDPILAGTIEAALLADGVPADQLFPIDLERALRKFDTIKDDIIWYKTGAEQVSLYQQGEAVMGQGWDGRIIPLIREGAPVEMVTTPMLMGIGYYVIPKGAKSAAAANQFLAFTESPEEQAKLAACTGYSPTRARAYDLIPADRKPSIDPTKLEQYILVDFKYWNENRQATQDRFNEWIGE
jgi:putative spermidine/putrescine transport system substrate-binding protein